MRSLNVRRLSGPVTALVWTLLAATTPAYAGGSTIGPIIFDPTNYMVNIQKSAATLQKEIQGVASAVREATMLENSVKNAVNAVKNLKGVGSITGDINALQSLWNVDSTLVNQLGGQAQFVQNVMGQYAATGASGSFSSYLGMLANQQQLGSKNAAALFANYQHMTGEIQSTIQQRQTIATQNSGTLGKNDQIQVTNAQLDNLSEINQATLEGISTLVRQAAYDQSVEAGQLTAHSQTSTAYGTYIQNGVQAFQSAHPAVTSIMGY